MEQIKVKVKIANYFKSRVLHSILAMGRPRVINILE